MVILLIIMIIKQYIKDFEKLGFGLFVHFGPYSVIGKGEWSQELLQISNEEYAKAVQSFNPDPEWAKNLVALAKSTGCKYINLTTRHHDGFSLYDTCGLNDFDAPHVCGRDLVREFVDACRAEGIVPFFYHTLFDWKDDFFATDFKGYMKYLQDSVEILCKNYGKIGGLWFDGWWRAKEEDWQEDTLYGLIRKYQPEAMIVNNTGLFELGHRGHIEIDSVTFERGKAANVNTPDAPKYVAGEMCQVMNDHWGYAAEDINYKSVGSLINDLVQCRRVGCNFLLNVGPMGNGQVRAIDGEILRLIGKWVEKNAEAIYETEPCGIELDNSEDFLLKKGNAYYLFRINVPMSANPDVALSGAYRQSVAFALDKKVRSATWLDDGVSASYEHKDGKLEIKTQAYEYGKSRFVRVCKIECE